MKQRLQKIISSSGISSRRKAEDLIKSKRVKINGNLATLGSLADPENDHIELDGNIITPQIKRYVLLNKPLGYICTMQDTHDRKIVSSLIPFKERIYPVGRLDIDTSGLIILTNDGEFSNMITHPKNKIIKRYLVTTYKDIDSSQIDKLYRGVYLGDGYAKVHKVIRLQNKKRIQIDIGYGKNRIIRRLMRALGNPVFQLKRIKIGHLKLYGLESGEWKTISKDERDKLLHRDSRTYK